MEKRPLPDTGEIATFTVIHAPMPAFSDNVQYTTAVVDFGLVQLTGQVRGVNPEAVNTEMTVTPAIIETETTGDRIIGFQPQ